MNMLELAAAAVLTAFWLLHGSMVSAQETQAHAQATGSAVEQEPAADVFPQDQIEQLVAPIALYPDALLAQVLMASTYPLDVVQAARWQNDNAGVKDEALETAAAEEPWDQSVKTLLFFPDVLAYMNDNLDWTQDLGDAVLAQQDDVTEAVQILRREAMAAGNLASTEQQQVEVAPAAGDVQAKGGSETIVIQPADPQVVYVPSYNPSTVYGQAEPPATTYYPQAYSTPTTSDDSASGSSDSDNLVSFGVGALAGGLLTAAILWDDDDDDRIYYGGPGYYGRPGYWNAPGYWDGGYRKPASINVNRDVDINRGDINISRDRGDVNIDRSVKKWEHNPERRGGVRYKDKETQKRYASVSQGGIDRDTARGRDPKRQRPEAAGKDPAQLSDRERPAKGEIDRPKTGDREKPVIADAKRPPQREAKRPEARPAKAPAGKDIKRAEKAPTNTAQKRDVKLSKPAVGTKKPVAKPAAKPAAAKAGRAAKPSGGKAGAFNKSQKGGQARASSNRGAKSRGGGGGRKGGGRRG